MDKNIIIYHGSQQIVSNPQFGVGKPYNDYGQGFYCTENLELAKEWACPTQSNGFANKYVLHLADLNTMYLTRGKFNILNWLAILLAHRTFDISSPLGNTAKDFILSKFMPDTTGVDIMIGYRADDSYFSFAEDFVNGTLSLRDLSSAMRLGTLGEQIVLLSEKSFGKIDFMESETVDYNIYYEKRQKRDKQAREAYAASKNIQQIKDNIYILDIIREDMQNDDPRLQSSISV